MSSHRELFGGAITVILPSILKDASTFRQVPDTQEVFISPSSDVSYIVEILQMVDPNDPREAAKFHFDSLAHDNDAVDSSILDIELPKDTSMTSPEATPSPILLDGLQRVSKFNRQHNDEVRIFLAIYRIASKGVDLVLSANLPLETETGGGLGQEDFHSAKEAFLVAARSLKIEDFGLFT
ncbi:Mog1p/PsbP-like protein [Phellopilus nigrolimitatus]|nr:Mog1p/PsbP-like protein [Phellopilus nigrolimitatus]